MSASPEPDFSEQLEFSLEPEEERSAKLDGYGVWRRQREEAIRILSKQLGLPVGHPVEVELKDGSLMQGLLELERPGILVPETLGASDRLRVGRCTFLPVEIARCVRLD